MFGKIAKNSKIYHNPAGDIVAIEDQYWIILSGMTGSYFGISLSDFTSCFDRNPKIAYESIADYLKLLGGNNKRLMWLCRLLSAAMKVSIKDEAADKIKRDVFGMMDEMEKHNDESDKSRRNKKIHSR